MKETMQSDRTGITYIPADSIRILNIKQVGFYMENSATLLDVYPSKDFKTGDDIVVFVFDKKETFDLYRKWMDRRNENIRKYVIATLSSPTRYLKSLHFGRYCFVEDIEGATKFLSKKLANKMISYYIADTGDSDVELVVVPVEITYNLIKEMVD